MNNLFIIVKHPEKDIESENHYVNTWQYDWKLQSIETKPLLIGICKELSKSDWVYIYRTRLDKRTPQAIVCRCQIERVDTDANRIYFANHEQLLEKPPTNAMPGMLSFWHSVELEPKTQSKMVSNQPEARATGKLTLVKNKAS